MHTMAVLGTVIFTAVVKDAFNKPLLATLGIGLFLGGLLATAKISYTHGLSQPADSVRLGFSIVLIYAQLTIQSCCVQVENVNFNLSLFFQCFALGSLIANSLCALSNKGGL